MVNIPKNNFNERGLNEIKGEGDMRTLGFGRIFSGRITRGQEIFVIGVKNKKVKN
jgi:translation elongation factor EF-G